ncbi:MAG: type I DNA topoisomerase [Anaerolineales bacterium]|nr:type I DNA topoisomerase [Anaerolineales bacterium]
MAHPEATFTKSGVAATKGICSECGTKLYRMGRTDAHEGLAPPVVVRPVKQKPERKGNLVIVESPAKARTVARFLGKGYTVKASVGHVRDLLRSQLSVDVENNFTPKYRVPNEKRPVVKEIKSSASKAANVYLATDPDREGEAIAWHLLEAAEIDPDVVHRVVFHEITKPAIEEAFSHPRDINMDLVDAQQGRRILDRLVGYNLSPLLWNKVRSRLSAGRVQSVALRLIIEREREILDFEPQEYWSIDAEFLNEEKPPVFRASLTQIDGEGLEVCNAGDAEKLVQALKKAAYSVEKVRRGTRKRKPSAPYTTSTMQQDASSRLNFTARKTMRIAQQLYEGIDLGDDMPTGLITYMRTDSTQISEQAQQEARALIKEKYGEEYLPDSPPTYKTKTKRAQEAHEAVRPTAVARTPDTLRSVLSRDQYRLYQLIWKRFIASQMQPAVYDTLAVTVEGKDENHIYTFRISASALRFPGFLKVYEDQKDPNGDAKNGNEKPDFKMDQIPDLQAQDPVNILEIYPEQHFTQPPPRFSDASLIKTMEENGIGRPSTYAPILTTLQNRGYVERQDRRLFPTEIGFTVNDLLVEYFPDIVDTGFTARMENKLDDIAGGNRDWAAVINEFYEPFSEKLEVAQAAMPEVKAEPEEIGRDCPECGKPLIIRYGRFGKFIGCSSFPECRYTEPWLEKIGVKCPECGGELVERRTRKGRIFYGCMNYPECGFISWKRPLPTPCPLCGGLLQAENKTKAGCTACESKFELEDVVESD